MFFGTPMRLNHSSLSEPIASLIQMPWHGSQLSRASLLSKSSGGVDEARRQETRMGKTRSFNEPCGGGNKNRSRRRLRLQGVGRGGVAMQGVEHREWTSSQLPHRGVVATRRLREGPSPEDSERSARNARAAVCEVAKEQQARQQQGGHWNGFIHHITVHIGGRVNR